MGSDLFEHSPCSDLGLGGPAFDDSSSLQSLGEVSVLADHLRSGLQESSFD